MPVKRNSPIRLFSRYKKASALKRWGGDLAVMSGIDATKWHPELEVELQPSTYYYFVYRRGRAYTADGLLAIYRVDGVDLHTDPIVRIWRSPNYRMYLRENRVK